PSQPWVMESPMKTMSHSPGDSLARFKTISVRGWARASRGAGMIAVLVWVAGAAAGGAAGCAWRPIASKQDNRKRGCFIVRNASVAGSGTGFNLEALRMNKCFERKGAEEAEVKLGEQPGLFGVQNLYPFAPVNPSERETDAI